MSYLEEYQRLDETFRILLDEAEVLKGDASQGLTPHGDYWLGYHHGRAAAKTRVSKRLQNSKLQEEGLDPSPA